MTSDMELGELAETLGQRLAERGATLASAESCTGGWISKVLTDNPGSSAWFGWGVVTYANEAKRSVLGVPAELLEQHGAVSEAVVRSMAEAARERSGAEFSVAVSGIAGPGGGTSDRPVGTVWFAWAGPAGTLAERSRFDGDRDSVRRQSVRHALEGVLRLLK